MCYRQVLLLVFTPKCTVFCRYRQVKDTKKRQMKVCRLNVFRCWNLLHQNLSCSSVTHADNVDALITCEQGGLRNHCSGRRNPSRLRPCGSTESAFISSTTSKSLLSAYGIYYVLLILQNKIVHPKRINPASLELFSTYHTTFLTKESLHIR